MQQFYLDIECYINYFYVGLMCEHGKTKGFEVFGEGATMSPEDMRLLVKLLTHKNVEVITFNGTSYDLPMIVYAVSGASCGMLKKASDDIICNNLKPWQFYRKYNLSEPEGVNHIDLIEVAPSMCSLKIYGGRMHTQKMQDLPYEPDHELTREEADEVKVYCRNDLQVTKELAEALTEQINLRRSLSDTYNIDLRSKSDAQISEAVLKSEYIRLTKKTPEKTEITYKSFPYVPPPYVKFRTPDLQEALSTICDSTFVIKQTGHVEMPKEVEKLLLKIGDTTYKLGIGGLHSQESEVMHAADGNTYLIDRDVVSYYPNLILNMGMAPASFGKHFQPVYRKILEERVEAKRNGDKVKSDSLKITLNGCFGKTSNRYSLLYNPIMMLHTTLTGQLSLLMLIEMLECYGVPVVSANTDGIVMKCPKDKYDNVNVLINRWEKHCGLETEETRYDALFSRDVNSYIAITTDGKVKSKGAYATGGLMKNPQNEICVEAVINHLVNYKDIEQTISECDDIRKFITVRTVNGGAIKEGYVLGKAIRWYYSTACRGEDIHYKNNGNMVPRSTGAKPITDLQETFPTDIDYEWYIKECHEILMSIGHTLRPVLPKIPRKNSKAWKALRDEGKIHEIGKGKWGWV